MTGSRTFEPKRKIHGKAMPHTTRARLASLPNVERDAVRRGGANDRAPPCYDTGEISMSFSMSWRERPAPVEAGLTSALYSSGRLSSKNSQDFL